MGGGEAANKVGNLKYSVKDGRMRPRGLYLDGYRRGGSVFLIPRLVSSYGASYFMYPIRSDGVDEIILDASILGS